MQQDVEANRAPSTAAPQPSQPTSQQPSEYAHMGRGGSGNWYQPSELQKDGTFTQPGDSTAVPTSSKPQISTPWHPENQELPVARSGRGGAGNFVWKSDEQVRKEREGRELDELKKKETVSQEVERDVEAVLARPGAARLGEDKLGRGW
jgi:GTPase involved in cell partitioning and DNA repair